MKINSIFSYIKSISRSISVLDIGASGGIGWPWNELNKDFIDLILVEPDPDEAVRLENKLNKTQKSFVVPIAFWNEQKSIIFNLNKSRATSSILNSNLTFLNQFSDSDRFNTEKKIKVECKTIDYLIENNQMPQFDFAKIDIQGGELAVLKGGKNYIQANVVGLEIEVEFAEIYSNQPLSAEIDVFVRNSLGLELWDISKAHWKYLNDLKSGPKKGRLIFGNALYLRPLEGLEKWLKGLSDKKASEKLLMLISTSLAYGFLDYASAILNNTSTSKYILNKDRKEILLKINSFSKGFGLFKNGNNFLFKVFHTLASFFRPSDNGRISDGILGSKNKGPFWIS